MKIREITNRNRRDFTAIYECEHCQHTHTDHGYDDYHFHTNVVPAMKCPECGLVATERYTPLATKYPDEQVV